MKTQIGRDCIYQFIIIKDYRPSNEDSRIRKHKLFYISEKRLGS